MGKDKPFYLINVRFFGSTKAQLFKKVGIDSHAIEKGGF